jgi:hypothetical protein
MERMKLEVVIGELRALAPGGHLHLDEVLTEPLPSGGHAWMPVLMELANQLTRVEGLWFISLPVGEVEPAHVALVGPETVFDLVSEPSSEPPSIHRSHDRLPAPWQGQKLSEATEVGGGVVMTTSLSRSSLERDRDDPWYATVTFAIRGEDDR